MASKTIRVDIPRVTDLMFNLATSALERHKLLGPDSPLNGNQINMAFFEEQLENAKKERSEAQEFHRLGKAAIQLADIALGIAENQNILTPGSVYNLIGRICKKLSEHYQGHEMEIGTYGFKVVIRYSGGRKRVRINIPLRNRSKLETLSDSIIARHKKLGPDSPLRDSQIDELKALLKEASDQRKEGRSLHEKGETATQSFNLILGLDRSQNIETPGTIYYMLNRIRTVLSLAYEGEEMQISTFGFKVVIRERKKYTKKKVADIDEGWVLKMVGG